MAMAVVVGVVLFAAVVDAGGGGGGGRRAAWTALDGVCGDLGGYYVTPELCKSALCGNGGGGDTTCQAASGAANVAALAARLAAANATATKASIEAAAASAQKTTSSSNGTSTAAGIRSCLELYGGAVAALEWAARSVAAGRYRGAREVLQATQYVSLGCEGIAGGHGGAGEAALPRENERFGAMAMVAHAVVASMIGPD